MDYDAVWTDEDHAEADQAVERGVALLDREKPDWAGLIDLDDLEMTDCARCVLGYVFGSFTTGATKLHLSFKAAYGKISDTKAHGFDGTTPWLEHMIAPRWEAVIRERQSEIG